MTNNQLRLQAFMIYPNAKVVHVNGHGDDRKTSVAWYCQQFQQCISTGTDTYFPSRFQLVLRPLEDITEEEYTQLCLDCNWRDAPSLNEWISTHKHRFFTAYEADFLRSKNFNLPYMGKDLVAEGIAIII